MPDLDCLSCGACCTHAGDVVVEATDNNVPRHLTRSVRGRMGFGSWEAEEGTRIMARRDCNSCAALSLKKGRHVCRIYEQRPAICRDFPVGGEECLKAPAAAGFPAPTPEGEKA